jgi:hypothetical protein
VSTSLAAELGTAKQLEINSGRPRFVSENRPVSMQATRFSVVASMIGIVAVVALLALAYDNASKGVEDTPTALVQVNLLRGII